MTECKHACAGGQSADDSAVMVLTAPHSSHVHGATTRLATTQLATDERSASAAFRPERRPRAVVMETPYMLQR